MPVINYRWIVVHEWDDDYAYVIRSADGRGTNEKVICHETERAAALRKAIAFNRYHRARKSGLRDILRWLAIYDSLRGLRAIEEARELARRRSGPTFFDVSHVYQAADRFDH